MGTSQPGVRAIDYDTELCPTQMVSGAADGSWRLWDMRQEESALRCIDAHDSAVTSVSVLGMRLITASHDGWAKLWDLRAGKAHDMSHVNGVYMLGLRPAERGSASVSQRRQTTA